ncbi:hypothetical protein WR25_08618 [Diploscapter pachys]|uniref:Nitric oxide synthase-interacting protein homolog n=1 Tax=Diploscapter pachys TaxID=2018661 RepID=A0A2A2L096_9BILA|nr:hypothetical protein WR25_08618 [Diploscapter pachys]
MTRHGKNCTASSVYSYHERKRDAKISGYGTLHARLGADSIKQFDCCSLTLQPCRDPVITPNGYLFDREAILEYILAQKKEIAKKTKLWEKQCAKEAEEAQKALSESEKLRLRKFAAQEATPAHPGVKVDVNSVEIDSEKKTYNPLKRPLTSEGTVVEQPAEKVKAHGNEGDLSNMKGQKSKQLPSFWIPELNPTASASKLEKPNQKVLCPISEKTLKLKDLMEVKFTETPDSEPSKSNAAKQHRYMCPVTHDVLTNTTRCAYLKTSKSIVTYDVVEKLIKKDWVDPISGDKITEEDIIELQRGGTGYAATNEVKAKLLRPQLELQ